MEKQKYSILPTMKVLEGFMLMGQVARLGFFTNLPIPKITEENYIDIVKSAVVGK